MKKTVLGILIGCLLVSGCGSAKSDTANFSAAESGGYYEAPEEAYEEAYYDDYDYTTDSTAEVSMEDGSYSTTVTFAQGKKIIYQSNVVLETKTYNETYMRLIGLINENGGYIEYENYNNEMRSYLRNNSGKGNIVISTNNMTIRIPSKNYAKFMQEGLTLGNVLNRNQTIQDKTSEYNTNKSYVDILNDEADYLAKQLSALENELKEAQANDRHYDEIIENMKDIAERKAQVEKELVPYKRVMDDIDEKVEYSTITMELREVDEFTVIVEEVEEETFLSQLKDTWNNAMSTLAGMFKSTILFLIAIIPGVVYLLFFAIIVFLIYKLVRRIIKSAGFKKLFGKKDDGFKLEPLPKDIAPVNGTTKTSVSKQTLTSQPVGKPVVTAQTTKTVTSATPASKPAETNKPAPKPEVTASTLAKNDNAKLSPDVIKTDGQKKYVSRADAKAYKDAKKAKADKAENAKTDKE